jgi:hypothetical protein
MGKGVFKEIDLDKPTQKTAQKPADGSENDEEEEKPSFMELEAGQWQDKRGHGLTFACLFVFSIILYFRPYELIPALSSFKSMAFYVGIVTLAVYFVSQMVIEGNLTARPREVNMVLLLGIAGLLSIPLAIEPLEAWNTFVDFLIKTILIFIVLVNVVRTERRMKLLMYLALVVSIYLCIHLIGDYNAGVFRIGSEETNTQRVGGAIKGLFDNSNDLALHLVTMTPLAFMLGLENKNPLRKILFWGITLLMIAAVIITFSRGGFLGLIAMALLLVRKIGRRNKSMALAALVAGAGLVYLSGGNPPFLARTLRGTLVWTAIEDAWRDGAALAGCSAGAMALTTQVPDIRHPLRDAEEGLGAVPGLSVLPHFDRFAGRLPDMVLTRLSNPPEGIVAVGIDEDTALVHGLGDLDGPAHVGGTGSGTTADGEWHVVGRQSVWVLGPDGRHEHPAGSRLTF